MLKVVVLCNASLDNFKLEVLNKVLKNSTIQICSAGVNFRKVKSNITKLRREYSKGRGGYILVQSFRKIFSKKDSLLAESFFERNGISTMRITKLYSSETYSFIRNYNPDVIFLSGFGIIKEPILSMAPSGIWSYHHGNMRKYRGGPPAFWEIYNGEEEVGVTLQRLDKGLDCGEIIMEKSFPIFKDDNWTKLKKRIYSGSTNMLNESLTALQRGDFVFKRLEFNELGKLYTLPNFRQWCRLQLKIFINGLK